MTTLKGLIVAVGRGDEDFWPASSIRAKQLVPLANRPILFFALEGLRDAGVEEVGIVVSSATGEAVREAVRDGQDWGLRITYIFQQEPLGLAHALLLAGPFVDESSFILQLGDGVLRDDLAPLVKRFGSGTDALVLLRNGGGELDADAELGQGPLAHLAMNGSRAAGELGLAGIGIFGPKLIDAAGEVSPSWRGQLELTDAIDRLIEQGGDVEFQLTDGWWRYSGAAADLLEANRFALDDMEPDRLRVAHEGQEIQGKVSIAPSAVVESTVVRGPVAIGPHAHVADSWIGPYTSLGHDVTVEGAEIENSIILPGASIKHLGSRMEASAVGRGAQVFRDFALPKALRLRVGDGVEVSLA